MATALRHRATGAIAAVLSAVGICAAGCASAHGSTSGRGAHPPPSGSAAARYLQIATVGNAGLERDIDAVTGRDKDNLKVADADLADASSVERRFDQALRTIRFAAPAAATAERLYAANESRATLTAAAATSRTLPELRSFLVRVDAANRSVEGQVRQIRVLLHLPPPDSS